MKVIDFKTVSPLFEMERDGEKPFTTRKIDPKDKRFRALAQWHPSFHWAIRITNPATGESFIREIVAVSFLQYLDRREDYFWKRHARFLDWQIIIMGEIL